MAYKPRNFTMECYFDDRQGKKMVKVHRGNFEEVRDCLSPQMIETQELTLDHPMKTPRKAQKAFAKRMQAGMWHF